MSNDMVVQKEYEFKHLLNKEQFQYILKNFKNNYPFSETNIINYYYDNDKLNLNTEGLTLRGRMLDNEKLYLQLKVPVYKKGNLRVKTEYEIPIDNIPKDPTPLINHICKFTDLSLKGTLETNRYTFEIDIGIKLLLDSNRYLGVVDYELELEFIPELISRATNLFLSFKEDFSLDSNLCIGKRKRFFKQFNHNN